MDKWKSADRKKLRQGESQKREDQRGRKLEEGRSEREKVRREKIREEESQSREDAGARKGGKVAKPCVFFPWFMA